MKSAVLAICLCFLPFIGCVSQKDVNTLDTRLNELELRNAETRKKSESIKSDLQVRVDEEQAMRNQVASLRAKTDALGEEMRLLNGKIEELQYALKQQQKGEGDRKQAKDDRFDSLAASLKSNDERIYRIEQYLNFESSAKAAAVEDSEKSTPQAVATESPKAEIKEDEIYRLAKQSFDQGDSDAARKKFQELIERYPQSEQADNAQFWIGEIYYREKWYEKAILEYQKVIENYPKGNKVPASLLKQGFAFLNLNDKANCRLILEELIKKYPKTNEAKIAGDKLKELQ